MLVLFRPIDEAPSELELVLTRRSRDLLSHSGQVAFPGGGFEHTDRDATDTALRETEEELGIERSAIEVIGRLDDFDTITGYHLSPVVGLLTRQVSFRPDASEVARVFSVPLTLLMDEDRWRTQLHRYGGEQFPVWHLGYDGEHIWGVTAAILRGLIELLRDEPTIMGGG